MKFVEIELSGAHVIEPEKLGDERGFFARIWCEKEFADHGLKPGIVQSNVGFSPKAGTLRGLHFQIQPHAEIKVLRCPRGAIFDVIVDLRPESPTFKQWHGVELSAENGKMIYVPEGFAQGYLTLAENTEIYYHTSEFYHPESASGIRYDDAEFALEWPVPIEVISDQDQNWPDFTTRKESNVHS